MKNCYYCKNQLYQTTYTNKTSCSKCYCINTFDSENLIELDMSTLLNNRIFYITHFIKENKTHIMSFNHSNEETIVPLIKTEILNFNACDVITPTNIKEKLKLFLPLL